MAGVEQGTTVEGDGAGSTSEPSALRIDTDVLTTLAETATSDGDTTPTIVRWFDCWRR